MQPVLRFSKRKVSSFICFMCKGGYTLSNLGFKLEMSSIVTNLSSKSLSERKNLVLD